MRRAGLNYHMVNLLMTHSCDLLFNVGIDVEECGVIEECDVAWFLFDIDAMQMFLKVIKKDDTLERYVHAYMRLDNRPLMEDDSVVIDEDVIVKVAVARLETFVQLLDHCVKLYC